MVPGEITQLVGMCTDIFVSEKGYKNITIQTFGLTRELSVQKNEDRFEVGQWYKIMGSMAVNKIGRLSLTPSQVEKLPASSISFAPSKA
jgi:hypothetical protein